MTLFIRILYLELALAILSPDMLHSQQYKDKIISIKVKNLVAEMTLDEKIGQMTQVDHRYLEQKSDIKTYFLGSLLSGGGSAPDTNNPRSWVRMYNEYQGLALDTRLAIPLIYGIDAVHGHNNVYGATIFPHNIGLGCSNDEKLVQEISEATAREVRATGLDWTFAPCLAVSQDERWGRTFESYSENTEIVTRLGIASIKGYQGNNLDNSNLVLACAKHYVGDGNTIFGTGINGGIDRGDVLVDEKELRSKYIKPFRSAVENGVGSIMISYNSWQSKKLHGHSYLINDILKNELGFSGFVVSDWAAIDDIDEDYKTSIITAINAGIDMVMVPGEHSNKSHSYIEFINLLKESVLEGSVSINRIDDAVYRILKIKYSMGLFEKPLKDYKKLNEVGSSKNRELAREGVNKSVVLLQNNNILPISKNIKSILVAGEHGHDLGYQCGGWSISWQGGSGNTTIGTTILDGIRDNIGNQSSVSFSKNGDEPNDHDIIIAVVGETPYAEMKGDSESLELSNKDKLLLERLIKTGKPIVLILISGRPMIITPYLEHVDAVLAAWLPGTEGSGVADLLFGDVSPTAKLSFSWPRDMSQIPINYGDKTYDPLFPLGYGLTY
ncbi:MAG: beta-glucosidase [Candidatus Marinimicrobia bacterium]|jgi:beta-glucosidase|nr:beta-glucosidase [Candidatus Neomarinimicrobiota bacterium]MBT3848573.1 beta-glucosidase [Candidatus Neomarinimicrobiota bacterium]MBT5721865.1 beta-glucosidase [Candidatus Neomarinimicrobiota bacterium]MBT6711337.1 beta-glucosidase [Candidatus Neomarinimicrobiota bacterium]MBT6982356.1 beta-glucosidase [Candidatus Neomarinimicrobiota bacterium]